MDDSAVAAMRRLRWWVLLEGSVVVPGTGDAEVNAKQRLADLTGTQKCSRITSRSLRVQLFTSRWVMMIHTEWWLSGEAMSGSTLTTKEW